MTEQNYQLHSRCNPNGLNRDTGLIGQIHFATAQSTLDIQDQIEIKKLFPAFTRVMLGYRVRFWCVGHADHRLGWTYNDDLGLSRAMEVKSFLDRIFRGRTYYAGTSAVSRGEYEALSPNPLESEMASDRRVDIFANHLPHGTPVNLPMHYIFGRPPAEIQIIEVHAENHPPRGSIASRTTRPVDTRNSPGDRSGNSAARQIPRLFQAANDESIRYAIFEGIERVKPIVVDRMYEHDRGGILIVVVIDVSIHAGHEAGEVVAVFDHLGVFANHRDAIGHWRAQESLFTPRNRPPFGRLDYRFFWATRQR